MVMKTYKIIVIAIILLIVGGIGYYFLSNKTASDNIPSSVIKKAIENDGNKTVVDLNSLTFEGTGMTIENDVIYIVYGGTYEFTGSTSSNIIIDIQDDKDVYLVFNNINIASSSAPINIVQGDVFITLKDGTNNYLEYNKDYSSNEEVTAAIYSSDDITIAGNGKLEIKSNYDAISSKDTITIENGEYIINVLGDGIQAKDSVTINDGKFDIKTGDGYVATSKSMDFGMWNNETKNSDDRSSKGIKSSNLIVINGGTFNFDVSDDAIHSDGNLTISSGKFIIQSSDDAIHADGLVTIDGGEFEITASEGIEATYVKINDGTININATDDGINAGDKSKEYETTIEINGGNITIKMASGDTDGIDSNGNLYINGGTINVTCNSPFDYDGEAKYTGGTMIVNGEKTTTITNQMMGGMAPGGPMDGQKMNQNNQNNMNKKGGRI